MRDSYVCTRWIFIFDSDQAQINSAESIEWFLEEQALGFSLSEDLASWREIFHWVARGGQNEDRLPITSISTFDMTCRPHRLP